MSATKEAVARTKRARQRTRTVAGVQLTQHGLGWTTPWGADIERTDSDIAPWRISMNDAYRHFYRLDDAVLTLVGLRRGDR